MTSRQSSELTSGDLPDAMGIPRGMPPVRRDRCHRCGARDDRYFAPRSDFARLKPTERGVEDALAILDALVQFDPPHIVVGPHGAYQAGIDLLQEAGFLRREGDGRFVVSTRIPAVCGTCAFGKDRTRWPAARPRAAATHLGVQTHAAGPDARSLPSADRGVSQSQRLLGVEGSDDFECDDCGRWSSVIDAAEWVRLVLACDLEVSESNWIALLDAPQDEPIRAARLQRRLKMEYDEAVRVLSHAHRMGLLRRNGKGFRRAPAICGPCVARRATEASRDSSGGRLREAVPPQLRFHVLQRDAFRCRYCGRSAPEGAVLQVDHLVPVASGGTTDEDNLITACSVCNLGKSARHVV